MNSTTKFIIADDGRAAFVKSINADKSGYIRDVQTCKDQSDAQDFDNLTEAQECATWLNDNGYDARVYVLA